MGRNPPINYCQTNQDMPERLQDVKKGSSLAINIYLNKLT